MAITVPPLPYADTALEPHMTANTLSFHFGKHHQAYATNLNKLIAGTDLEDNTLLEIIQQSAIDSKLAGVFNNASQVFNHSFFWESMKPQGGGAPHGKIAELINSSFGSYEKFAEAFTAAAMTQFGSGWAWLVLDGDKLVIEKTANADSPIAHGRKPLITIDVWEHAYYLDFQNLRPKYIQTFLDSLVNWDFANSNI
tara:strand:- start:780 stop:1370 length:591 start_codon:yes stop_codon:yes gene_type:complete